MRARQPINEEDNDGDVPLFALKMLFLFCSPQMEITPAVLS